MATCPVRQSVIEQDADLQPIHTEELLALSAEGSRTSFGSSAGGVGRGESRSSSEWSSCGGFDCGGEVYIGHVQSRTWASQVWDDKGTSIHCMQKTLHFFLFLMFYIFFLYSLLPFSPLAVFSPFLRVPCSFSLSSSRLLVVFFLRTPFAFFSYIFLFDFPLFFCSQLS